MMSGKGLFLGGAILLALAVAGRAQTPPPADDWVVTPAQYPPAVQNRPVRTNDFQNLRAEVVAGKLKILWLPPPALAPGAVTVHASADSLGHWPARDWRPHPMARQGRHWEASLPVEDLDVPVVYFLSLNATNPPAVTGLSPLRVCRPRAAGLDEPTQVFWPYLEGFEEDLESWHLLTNAPGVPPLATAPDARNGRAALLISLPAGQRSVTVATTRLRGWQLRRQQATGVRLWLRTRQGAGRARFALFAHAFTPDQMVAVAPNPLRLTEAWQRVDVLFSDFPRVPLGAVDLFTVEFLGEGPQSYLIDDLQLLGPWKTELD